MEEFAVIADSSFAVRIDRLPPTDTHSLAVTVGRVVVANRGCVQRTSPVFGFALVQAKQRDESKQYCPKVNDLWTIP